MRAGLNAGVGKATEEAHRRAQEAEKSNNTQRPGSATAAAAAAVPHQRAQAAAAAGAEPTGIFARETAANKACQPEPTKKDDASPPPQRKSNATKDPKHATIDDGYKADTDA